MKNIKILLISFVILFLFIAGLVYYSFFIVPYSQRGSYPIDREFKTLYLESTLQEGYYSIVIDFNYTDSELSQFSQPKIDSLKVYYSEHDTIKAYFNGGRWSISKKLPILVHDSTLFPQDFYIQIYNKDNMKLLRELNFQEFEQLAEADYMSFTKNFLTAREWTLTIDSTLLGLKDSIR